MPGNPAAFDIEVEHGEKLAVRARIRDQRLSAAVPDPRRLRNGVVGVTAKDDVDAGDTTGELEIDIRTIVRQEHDDERTLGARFVHDFLERFLLDAERPLGNEVPGIRNRGVGKGLADDRHRHAAEAADRVGFEDGIAKVQRFHVLGKELDFSREFPLDRFLHPLGTVGEFPVPGHDIDAEKFRRFDHVGSLGPERHARALPGVAAVQQQRVRPFRAQALHQRGEVREAADFAVGFCRAGIVQVGKRMGTGSAGLDLKMLEQVLADKMRRVARLLADADVDIRLAVVDRQKLRMAVGEVQERDIAEAGQLIERIAIALGEGVPGIERKPARRGDREHFQEFSAVHWQEA